MLVLLGYFLIAAGAGIAASGIIGFVIANLLIARYERLTGQSDYHQNKRNSDILYFWS